MPKVAWVEPLQRHEHDNFLMRKSLKKPRKFDAVASTVRGLVQLRRAHLERMHEARISAVAFHRFKIGQQVVATAFGAVTGPYEITRLLPLVAGVPYYRAKKLPNGPERALSELSLRPNPKSAGSNGTQPCGGKINTGA